MFNCYDNRTNADFQCSEDFDYMSLIAYYQNLIFQNNLEIMQYHDYLYHVVLEEDRININAIIDNYNQQNAMYCYYISYYYGLYMAINPIHCSNLEENYPILNLDNFPIQEFAVKKSRKIELPTTSQKPFIIYRIENFQMNDTGKWSLFFHTRQSVDKIKQHCQKFHVETKNVNVYDMIWLCVVKLFRAGSFEGIVNISCSSVSNYRRFVVISFNCNFSDDKDNILRIGYQIIDILGYKINKPILYKRWLSDEILYSIEPENRS